MSSEENLQVLEKMVQVGASVKTGKLSPLFVCCGNSHDKSPAILNFLINAECDVNEKVKLSSTFVSNILKDENGWTCIHGAVKAHDFEAIKILLQA